MRRRPSGDARKKQRRVFKNDDIKAHKILLVDEEGKKSGVMPRAKALQMAEEAGMDLVQLSYDPQDQVATAKIVDYGRYMYDKQKEESEKKKVQTNKGQKEIKFGYNIGENDLELKIKKAIEFLEKGYNVKIMVVLKGREKVYKASVREKIVYVEQALELHGKSQGIRDEMFGYTLILMAKRRKHG